MRSEREGRRLRESFQVGLLSITKEREKERAQNGGEQLKRVGCFVEGRKKLAHAHQKEIKKTYLLSRRGLLLDLAREGDVAVESKIEYANERRARFYFFQKKLSRSCRRRRRVRRSFAGAGDSRFHKRKKQSV